MQFWKGAYRVEPVCVHCLLATGTLRHKHSPFPSMLAPRILPLRFYALFEEVKICSRCYPAGGLDVVVQTANECTVQQQVASVARGKHI